ncbi:MAG: gamma-glutamylcyclotransferase [Hyphomicrobiales bacterium]
MPPSPRHLFVYGSLLSGARHAMGARLRAAAALAGAAAMPGRLYDLGAYPGAVHDSDARGIVVGELWALRRPGLLLRQLDLYEGCAPGQPEPHAFRREVAGVVLMGNRALPAWVYLWTGGPAGRRPVAGGDWLVHVSARTARPARAHI